MPAMGGGNQRSVVIEAGDGPRIAATLQSEIEHLKIIVHRRYRENVVALGIECIRIGAQPQERPRGAVLAQKRGDVQRRTAVSVLNIRLFALTDQPLDFADVAARGSVVQSGVDTQLPLARRALREARCAGKLDRADHDYSKAGQVSGHGCMHSPVDSMLDNLVEEDIIAGSKRLNSACAIPA